MISIAGNSEAAFDDSVLSHMERNVYRRKKNSSVLYSYESADELLFELRMRSRIIEESRALDQSGVTFAGFRDSRCNEDYWERDDLGGFRLISGKSPSEAISDIFTNGQFYTFECATAVTIILYKSILDMMGAEKFDSLFSNLILYDWHQHRNLRIKTERSRSEAVAADIVYFENPDFLPSAPWWRGENAIKLEGGLYYGHGAGIQTEDTIIGVLNRTRTPGSTTPAFLSDRLTRPDFAYLYKLQTDAGSRGGRGRRIVAKIGSIVYVS
ncbi:protein-glutamine gamma-glutamyltransferase [Paenibacillus piri]|nr:protein-glutamine gamma-glutamyltransferase [Paenibacillus piri]